MSAEIWNQTSSAYPSDLFYEGAVPYDGSVFARCKASIHEWDGSAWTDHSASLSFPAPRFQHTSDHLVHAGKLWVVGSSVEDLGGTSYRIHWRVWSYNGTTWTIEQTWTQDITTFAPNSFSWLACSGLASSGGVLACAMHVAYADLFDIGKSYDTVRHYDGAVWTQPYEYTEPLESPSNYPLELGVFAVGSDLYTLRGESHSGYWHILMWDGATYVPHAAFDAHWGYFDVNGQSNRYGQDASGHLWVLAHNCYEVDLANGTLTDHGALSTYSTPNWDGSTYLYAPDTNNHRIWRIAPSPTVIVTAFETVAAPHASVGGCGSDGSIMWAWAGSASVGTWQRVGPNAAPNAPAGLAITGGTPSVDDTPEFTWTFDDDDVGDTQFKFFLRINDGATDVYTATVETAAASHTVTSALPDGSYTAYVKTWDDHNTEGDEASLAFVLNANTAPNAPHDLAVDGDGTIPVYTVDTTPLVTWTFDDDDAGSTQSAFQVRINDGATDVYDSGKVSSALGSHAVASALADDDYTVYVRTWDDGDEVGPEASIAFIVDTVAPSAPTGLTANSATQTSISLSWTASTDANGIDHYEVYRDGVLWGNVPGTQCTVAGLSAATAYAFIVRAADPAGNVSGPSNTLTTSTSTVDSVAPVVTIISPANGAVVADNSLTVVATITDAGGVASATLMVAGQTQGAMANTSGDTWQATWAASSWENASYTIRVEALDGDGNIGFAEITITLNRSLATATKWIVTKMLPLDADEWEMTGLQLSKLLTIFDDLYVDPDESRNYYVQCLVHVPGSSVDPDDYQLLDRRHTTLMLDSGATLRLGWRFTPYYVETAWATNSTTLHFPVEYTENGTDKLGFWGEAEDRLYSFDGSTVSTLADLDAVLGAYTVHDLERADDLWWLAVEPTGAGNTGIYQVDIGAEAGDQPLWIIMPASEIVAALATYASDLYIGTDDGDATGQVFRYDPDSTKLYKIGDVDGAITSMAAYASGVLIGTDTGKIYATTGDIVGLAHDTADATISWVGSIGSNLYAAVGNKLYGTISGSWALETTFAGETALTWLLEYRDQRWAGFSASAHLWRHDPALGWTLSDTISDTTATGGLAVLGDGLIALTTDGADGKVWRREVSDRSGGAVLARYIGDIACELLETT